MGKAQPIKPAGVTYSAQASEPAFLRLLNGYAAYMRLTECCSLVALVNECRAELAGDSRFATIVRAFDGGADVGKKDPAWISTLLDSIEAVSRVHTGRTLRRLEGDPEDLEVEGEPARMPEGDTDRIKVADGF